MFQAYLHGYSPQEQQRLVDQAEYWRNSLIPLGLTLKSGERLLEIGCGAGATLGVLATLFPGIAPAGIDREPRQIAFARTHLESLGVVEADLRTGDAAALPWPSGTFDHVYIMWLIEHLPAPCPILREAFRVLKPGTTITMTETDYTTFKVDPGSADYEYLEQTQYEYFARYGNPIAGRQLGALLHGAGFIEVVNRPVGFHFFFGCDAAPLREHVDYLAAFIEPGIPTMADRLGRDEMRLRRGLAHLRTLPEHSGSSITTIVYRAYARKPARQR
jgi:ubiquinone/menaquinone biosynthesis C-methylase UbiE